MNSISHSIKWIVTLLVAIVISIFALLVVSQEANASVIVGNGNNEGALQEKDKAYSGSSLEEELLEENNRFDPILKLNAYLKAELNINQRIANRIKNKYGVSVLMSSNYYNIQAQNLEREISNLQQRKIYTQSETERIKLEKEIKEKQDELKKIIALEGAAEYQEKADNIQRQLNNLNFEAEESYHKNSIDEICKRHGVKNPNVAEIEYICLDAREYQYTGKKIHPVVTVIDSNGKVLGDESFVAEYPSDCISPGKHIITLNLRGDYIGTKSKMFTITEKIDKPIHTNKPSGNNPPALNNNKTKKINTMTLRINTRKVKFKKLKMRARTVAPITVKNAKGVVRYKVVGGNAKSKKVLKLNAKTGKITVKKKTKKGKYILKVKVTAAGTVKYKPANKTVTVTVKVK